MRSGRGCLRSAKPGESAPSASPHIHDPRRRLWRLRVPPAAATNASSPLFARPTAATSSSCSASSPYGSLSSSTCLSRLRTKWCSSPSASTPSPSALSSPACFENDLPLPPCSSMSGCLTAARLAAWPPSPHARRENLPRASFRGRRSPPHSSMSTDTVFSATSPSAGLLFPVREAASAAVSLPPSAASAARSTLIASTARCGSPLSAR